MFLKRCKEFFGDFLRRFLGINQIMEEMHQVNDKTTTSKQLLDNIVNDMFAQNIRYKEFLEQNSKNTNEFMQAFSLDLSLLQQAFKEHDKKKEIFLSKIEKISISYSDDSKAIQEALNTFNLNLSKYQEILLSIQADLENISNNSEGTHKSHKLILDDIQKRTESLIENAENNKQIFVNLQNAAKLQDEYIRLMLINVTMNQAENILRKHK